MKAKPNLHTITEKKYRADILKEARKRWHLLTKAQRFLLVEYGVMMLIRQEELKLNSKSLRTVD